MTPGVQPQPAAPSLSAPDRAALLTRRLLLLILAAIAVFHLATLHQGHGWGDDFALYIQHARNLAQLKPYSDTGYIFNPEYPSIGPRDYPPLYPLLLAPVYRIAGLNLTAMKTLNIALFVGALAAAFALFRRDLRAPYALAAVVVLGFNNSIWGIKENIAADVLFLFLAILALLAAGRTCAGGSTAALAVAVPLSYLARTIGIVFLPVLALRDLLQTRRISRRTLVVTATTLLTAAAGSLWFQSTGSYVASFTSMPAAFVHNFYWYAWNFQAYFCYSGWGPAPAVAMAAVLALCGALGFLTLLRQAVTAREIFAAAYTAAIVIWIPGDFRLLLPSVTLFVFYCAAGVALIDSRLRARRWIPAGPLLAAGLAVVYAGAYAHSDFGPVRQGLGDPAFLDLCRYIRAETPPDSVFLFAKPRLLALATDRRASAYHQPADYGRLRAYLRRIGAGYVILSDQFPSDTAYLARFVAASRGELAEVYRKDGFTMYRLEPSAPALPARATP